MKLVNFLLLFIALELLHGISSISPPDQKFLSIQSNGINVPYISIVVTNSSDILSNITDFYWNSLASLYHEPFFTYSPVSKIFIYSTIYSTNASITYLNDFSNPITQVFDIPDIDKQDGFVLNYAAIDDENKLLYFFAALDVENDSEGGFIYAVKFGSTQILNTIKINPPANYEFALMEGYFAYANGIFWFEVFNVNNNKEIALVGYNSTAHQLYFDIVPVNVTDGLDGFVIADANNTKVYLVDSNEISSFDYNAHDFTTVRFNNFCGGEQPHSFFFDSKDSTVAYGSMFCGDGYEHSPYMNFVCAYDLVGGSENCTAINNPGMYAQVFVPFALFN